VDWWHEAAAIRPQDDTLYLLAYAYAHLWAAPGDATLRQWCGRKALDLLDECCCAVPIHDVQVLPLVRALHVIDGYRQATPEPPAPAARLSAPPSRARRLAALCRAFPGTTPGYWYDGIAEGEARRIEAAHYQAERGGWAESATRGDAIAAFLRGVKCVRTAARARADAAKAAARKGARRG
jgi:hypothetical protein